MSAGFVSVKIFDEAGNRLDSDAVLAHYYISGSPLYDVVSSLIRASNIGELFALFRREGFRVRFSKEEVAWRVEHYSYPVKGLLHPQEDGGFVLEVVVPGVKVDAERALLGAWRAIRALHEVREELGKLKERIGQLEDEVKEHREELRGIREALRSFEERLREEEGGEGEGEEQE
jgi:hypothetical protein